MTSNQITTRGLAGEARRSVKLTTTSTAPYLSPSGASSGVHVAKLPWVPLRLCVCRELSTIVACDKEREQDWSLVRVRDVACHRGRRLGGRAGQLHQRAVRGLPTGQVALMVRTFLKVYMELGSYFLFLQEQIKDIIIIRRISGAMSTLCRKSSTRTSLLHSFGARLISSTSF